MIRHILLKRENNIGSVVDIVSVWKVLSVFCIMFLLIIGCGEPNLDDPKVREEVIAKAINEDSLQTRRTPSGEELHYAPNQERPYAGWVKSGRTLYQFQNGKPNGLYINWYSNNQNYQKGIFRNGQRNGLWTEWYENGQKSREGSYKNNKQDSTWVFWYGNGQKSSEGTYTDDSKDGLWTEWYSDGTEKSKGTYKSGNRDGAWVFSYANGNTLASGSEDETIRLWDIRRGEHIRTLSGHTDGVIGVAFSPDGNTLASGSVDETIRLWDANTGRHLRTLTGHTDSVSRMAFRPLVPR